MWRRLLLSAGALLLLPLLCSGLLPASSARRSGGSTHLTNQQQQKQQIQQTLLLPPQSSTSRCMYGRPWYEDDLPNILGINPLEAAVLFGVLYYVYGPTVLYEFSREAGKLFSTYAPIVKDVSVDLFNELRDYLEEDREREQLRKAGADLSVLPRRTSNIIERLQGGIEAFSAISSTGQLADAKMELKNAYSVKSDIDIDSSESIEATSSISSRSSSQGVIAADEPAGTASRKRKSKRDVLLSRNVDIDKVIEATNIESQSTGGATLDNDLSQSISMVQDRFEAIAERARGGGSSDASSSGSSSSASGAVGMNRFQQQLAGNWNSQVIASTENITFENTEYVNSSDDFDDESDIYKNNNAFRGYEDDGAFDMAKSFVRSSSSSRPPDVPSDWLVGSGGDIPSELSAFDDLDNAVSVSAPDLLKLKIGAGLDGKPSSEIAGVIAAMDRDYFSLRNRMLAALRKFEPPAAASGTSCCDDCQSEGYWDRFFDVI